jgi:hypothetical protein
MSLMCKYLALQSRFLQSFSLVLALMFNRRARARAFKQILVFVIVAVCREQAGAPP